MLVSEQHLLSYAPNSNGDLLCFSLYGEWCDDVTCAQGQKDRQLWESGGWDGRKWGWSQCG